MAVFATLFGRMAGRLSPKHVAETLESHVGAVPNPLSERSKNLRPRIDGAKMVKSVCPYCAVGCGQRVYVKDNKVIDIEGDYDSPINGGCLCPKGAASYQLAMNERRRTKVMYRRPYGTEWEERSLEWAMARVAQLTYETREETFRERDEQGRTLNHTLGIGSLGGATLDSEENYLITKLFHSLGMVAIENQARI
ncbi:dehydrogenase [Dictyobacter sp. S3.2.2.5]|uniref:Dehydrogenase n=1 Tax=Dictyobacter halimunensis TaxID=3026934 RepID=A0ABQ6G465_9CHLR|nr:dehydrogenase [Dictyobacter sp. S3.2.2.5]